MKIERKIESHVWSDDCADVEVDAGESWNYIRLCFGPHNDGSMTYNKRDVLAMLEHLDHMERFKKIYEMISRA